MSGDRFLTAEIGFGAGMRCSLDHVKEIRAHYCGTIRPPREKDEQGALVVVELLFSGGIRRAFFLLPGVDQCQIVDLPTR